MELRAKDLLVWNTLGASRDFIGGSKFSRFKEKGIVLYREICFFSVRKRVWETDTTIWGKQRCGSKGDEDSYERLSPIASLLKIEEGS